MKPVRALVTTAFLVAGTVASSQAPPAGGPRLDGIYRNQFGHHGPSYIRFCANGTLCADSYTPFFDDHGEAARSLGEGCQRTGACTHRYQIDGEKVVMPKSMGWSEEGTFEGDHMRVRTLLSGNVEPSHPDRLWEFIADEASAQPQEPPRADPAASAALIRAARTYRVDFGGVIGPATTLANPPVAATARRLLEHAGLREEAETPDLILRITFISSAPPRTQNVQVMNAPIGTMQLVLAYTEAIVSGSLEFHPRGGQPEIARFEGKYNDPYGFRPSPMGSHPEDAPFDQAFRLTFVPRLFHLLTGYYGQRVVTSALADEGAMIRGAAVRRLGEAAERGDTAATEALLEALSDPDEGVRSTATDTLVSLKEKAVMVIESRLEDPDPLIRVAAIDVLRQLPTKGAATGAFVAALDDPDARVRKKALDALTNTSFTTPVRLDDGAVASVIKILKGDPVRDVRMSAIGVLERTAGDRAIEPLIAVLESGDDGMADQAANALAALTGQHFGTKAKKWRAWLARGRHS